MPTTNPDGTQGADALAAYRNCLAEHLRTRILDALDRRGEQAVFRLVDGHLCLDEVRDAAGESRADEVDDVVLPLTTSPVDGVEVKLGPLVLFGAALVDIAHDPDGAVLVVDVGVLAAACRRRSR